MTDYLQKARELVMDFDGAVYTRTAIAHLATTLEALDKAEADRDRYAGLLMLAQEQHGKIKAGRNALREAGAFLLERLVDHEVRMTSDEDSREWYGHVTPAMARFRSLIQPEPDPLVEEKRIFCATVWNALKGDHNDLRRQQIILDAFRSARHGLAVKEVG